MAKKTKQAKEPENPDFSSEEEVLLVSSTSSGPCRRAPAAPLSKIPAPCTPPLPTDRPSDEIPEPSSSSQVVPHRPAPGTPKTLPPRPAPGTPKTPPGAALFAAQLPILASRVFEALQVFLLKITPPPYS